MSSKYMTSYTLAETLTALEKDNLLPADNRHEVTEFLSHDRDHKEMPLFLRCVVGVGAFLSSLFFLGFLGASQIVVFEEYPMIFWGILFIGLAVLLKYWAGQDDYSVRHSFLLQTSFCSIAVGKMLFVAGFYGLWEINWALPVGTFIVTAATYHAYRMSIDRFLSSFAVFASLTQCIFSHREFVLRESMFNIYFLILLLLAGFFFSYARLKRDYQPIGYAVVLTLCSLALYFMEPVSQQFSMVKQSYNLWFVNMLLVGSLWVLIGWASGSWEKLLSEPLLIACAAAACLGLISAPAVLLSIALFILGYARHDRILLAVAALFLPAALFTYYNSLTLTLAYKSAVLIGSGAVLLAGRQYLRFRELDKEPVK